MDSQTFFLGCSAALVWLCTLADFLFTQEVTRADSLRQFAKLLVTLTLCGLFVNSALR